MKTWQLTLASVGILVVAVAWIGRTTGGIARGMRTIDTLWYHLPVAARFVQLHRVTEIHFLDDDPVSSYFPWNSSLLHAVGMLFFGSDLVSTIVNVGWFALAIAAAWAAGRPWGVGPASALGMTFVLATPGIVETQPGGAYVDVVGLALLMTAIAIALQGTPSPRTVSQDLVAALACGLAAGTKFTFLAPAAAICLGLAVTSPRGARLRHTWVIAAGAIATSVCWYARNTIATGNPLPNFSADLGPLSLSALSTTPPTSSVSDFLADGKAWTNFLVPGFRSSLGPVWPAFLLFVFAGMVAAVVARTDVRVRMLGVVGMVSFVAFLFTPQYIEGGGAPVFFAVNLRYASPAFAIGLVLLPIALPRLRSWILIAYAAGIAVTQIDPTAWPTGFSWSTFGNRARGIDTIVALIVLCAAGLLAVGIRYIVQRVPRRRLRAPIVSAGVALALLVGLAVVHDRYLDRRYREGLLYPEAVAWARDTRDSRIATTGFVMQLQYPYAGTDLSNHVQYAGVETEDGGFRPYESCEEWVEFLETGRYAYAVIGPSENVGGWTASQPDAKLVSTEYVGDPPVTEVAVFALDPSVNRNCDDVSVPPG